MFVKYILTDLSAVRHEIFVDAGSDVLDVLSPFMGDRVCRSSAAGILCDPVFYKYVAAMRLVASLWGFEAELSE